MLADGWTSATESFRRDLWEWQHIREDDAVHHRELRESKADRTVCWTLFESPVTDGEPSCVLPSTPSVLASAPVTNDWAGFHLVKVGRTGEHLAVGWGGRREHCIKWNFKAEGKQGKEVRQLGVTHCGRKGFWLGVSQSSNMQAQTSVSLVRERRPHSSMALSASLTGLLVKSQPKQGCRPVDCTVRSPKCSTNFVCKIFIEWLLSNRPCWPRRIIVRTSLLFLQGLRTSGVTAFVIIYFLCNRHSGWGCVASQSSFNLLD